MYVDTSKVKSQYDDLMAANADVTFEEINASKRDAERLTDAIALAGEGENVSKERLQELAQAARLYNDFKYCTALGKTLKADLMKVETRYLVTNEELVSPAGFHPDDKVFLQTTVAIHTDTLDMKFPSVDGELKVYEINPPS